MAFAWNGSQHGRVFEIWVQAIGTQARVRLTSSPGNKSRPVWSPDGRAVAFLGQLLDSKWAISAVPASGGQDSKITDVTHPPASQGLAWSPDGKWLAVTGTMSPNERPGIFLVNRQTGEKRRITQPDTKGAFDHWPAFSPDGAQLAFVRSDASKGGDVYSQAIAGGMPSRLTSDRARVQGLAWNTNREIVFSSGREASLGLWRITLSGGTPQRVLLGANGELPAISVPAARLAFISHSASRGKETDTPGGSPIMLIENFR